MRRNFIQNVLAAVGLGMLIAPIRSAPQEPLAAQIETDFVKKFNKWASFRKQGGLVDVKEIRAWQATRAAWKKLDAIVKY